MRLVEATDRRYAWMLAEADAPAGSPPICAGGVAPREVLLLLRGVAAGLRAAGAAGPLAWLMVADGEAIGLVGLKSPAHGGPAYGGDVDFGYGVAPAYETRGHATRAVELLVGMMAARGVPALTPETSIHNRGSQRVLEKNGFGIVGERHDPEDGPLFRWRRELEGQGT